MRHEPFKGAAHTVDNIRKLAVACQQDYNLVLLRDQIVGRLESKDYVSEVLAVYYWVLGHTRYANDPRNVELVRSASEILRRLKANTQALLALAMGGTRWRPSLDCDDLVELLVGLFLCLGRQVQIVTVAFKDQFAHGERQYSHVLLRVKEPRSNTWIVLDPVGAEDTGAMLSRVTSAKIWPVA